VGVYADRILDALKHEETAVDVWFVVIPEVVYLHCRPRSNVAAEVRVKVVRKLNPRFARGLRRQPSLFAEDNLAAEAYHYEVDFHNQLKARLLGSRALTQVVREGTVMPISGVPDSERGKKDSRNFQAAIAWNLGTTAFYKAGGRPWKIHGIREGCATSVSYSSVTRRKRIPEQRAALPSSSWIREMGWSSGVL
jgi:hypothetical protein